MEPVHVYSRPWRLVAACLFVLSRANLPAMLFAIVFAQAPVNPPAVYRADVAGVEAARQSLRHATIVYAAAKATAGAWRWWNLALKFPVFALAPAVVLFRAHQHIAYGGTFGEYHLLGLSPFLQTAAIYWV